MGSKKKSLIQAAEGEGPGLLGEGRGVMLGRRRQMAA
jgi:hypothetical protein